MQLASHFNEIEGKSRSKSRAYQIQPVGAVALDDPLLPPRDMQWQSVVLRVLLTPTSFKTVRFEHAPEDNILVNLWTGMVDTV